MNARTTTTKLPARPSTYSAARWPHTAVGLHRRTICGQHRFGLAPNAQNPRWSLAAARRSRDNRPWAGAAGHTPVAPPYEQVPGGWIGFSHGRRTMLKSSPEAQRDVEDACSVCAYWPHLPSPGRRCVRPPSALRGGGADEAGRQPSWRSTPAQPRSGGAWPRPSRTHDGTVLAAREIAERCMQAQQALDLFDRHPAIDVTYRKSGCLVSPRRPFRTREGILAVAAARAPPGRQRWRLR